MNWGEIQLASVRKMFLNTKAISVEDLEAMRSDKKYLTYLDAMPDAANEGLMIAVTRGKPMIDRLIITAADADNDYVVDGYYTFILPEIAKSERVNYLSIDRVYIDGGDYYNYVVRDNYYLLVPMKDVDDHNVMVAYKTYPAKITKDTPANKVINAPIDILNILPLYIASELYKDDDISLATYYRNQFETELENMSRDVTDMHFVSVNGWL